MKNNYKSQYLDPRWQRKRLEILERDNYTCKRCNSADKTLHVHHRYYIGGRKVWEYANWSLITLCNECHDAMHGDETPPAWEPCLEMILLMQGSDQLDFPDRVKEVAALSGIEPADVMGMIAFMIIKNHSCIGDLLNDFSREMEIA